MFSLTIPAEASLTPSKLMTKFTCFVKGYTTANTSSETETFPADCTAKSKQLIEAVIPKDLKANMPQVFLFENIFEAPVSTVITGLFEI